MSKSRTINLIVFAALEFVLLILMTNHAMELRVSTASYIGMCIGYVVLCTALFAGVDEYIKNKEDKQ